MNELRLDDLRADSAWLRRLAAALVAEPAAAEDLVQETWLAALERRPDPSQPLRPWLGAVARNLWRMRLRTGAREEARLALRAEEDHAHSADDLLARAQAVRALADAVLALDEPYRSTILLRYFEGLSAAAIAERDGLPAGTVRWRLKEGLDRVRRALEARHGSDWRGALWLLQRPRFSTAWKGAMVVSKLGKSIAGLALLLAVLFGALAWRQTGRGENRAAKIASVSLAATASPELQRARETGAKSGAAAASIELRVETASAQPVPDAEVELFEEDPSQRPPRWTRARTARTDSAGRASLPAEGGSYLIAAHKDGVGAGSKAIWKPAFVATTSLLLVLRPAAAIAGRLLARSGGEVPLGHLSLTRWNAGAHGQAAPDALGREAIADVHGKFAFDSLEPGDYQLEARADGFAPARRFVSAPAPAPLEIALGDSGHLQGVVLDETGKAGVAAEVRALGFVDAAAHASDSGAYALELAPRAYRLIAIAPDGRVAASNGPVMIRAGATITAPPLRLVSPSTLAGHVRDSRGLAIAKARVHATSLAGDPFAGAESGADGAYALERVPPGRYRISVAAPGFNAIEQTIALAAGQRAALDFTLSAGGAIEGTVRDGKGTPVADASVIAGAHSGLASAEIFAAETSSGPDGHFFLDGVAPGATRVMALRAGALAGPSRLLDVAEGAIAKADFTLDDDAMLDGRVSLEGNQPLRGPAVVRIKVDDQQVAEVPCGADGAYRVRLAAGSYRVQAARLGAPASDGGRLLKLESGAAAHADLSLRDPDTPDTIQIAVTDLDGAPAAGATVMIQIETEGRQVGLIQTADDQGMSKLAPWTQIPAKQLELIAVLEGRSGSALLDAPALQASIQLVPSSAIQATISGANPDTALSVSILRAPDGQGPLPLHAPPITVVGNSFTLDSLPAVPAVVSVTAADGRSAESRVSLQPGETSQVRLTLDHGGVVSGRLVDARGQPVPGLVRIDSGNAISAAADGSFRAAGLNPGAHFFSAWLGDRFQPVSRDFSLDAGAALDLGNVVLLRAPATPEP